MRLTFKHILRALSVLAGLLLAASCRRVPLYDSSSGIYLELQLKLNLDLTVSDTINLDRYPDYYNKLHLAAPSRLAACFYDSKTHRLVVKEYVGPTGGYIKSVPSGTYDILVYELGTIVTQTTDDNVRGQLKAQTSDITSSVSPGFRLGSTRGTTSSSLNSSPIISEPDHILVARLSDVVIPEHADIDETIVIHADGSSMVETYSFIVKNVTGMENVRSVQALITGQASSRYLWDGHNPTAPVNLLTTSVVDRSRNCMYGVYNTFGQISAQIYFNILVTTTTGEELIYPVNVTDQIIDPDNTDHKITITDTIKVTPSGDGASEGYMPVVNEWDDEIIAVPIN